MDIVITTILIISIATALIINIIDDITYMKHIRHVKYERRRRKVIISMCIQIVMLVGGIILFIKLNSNNV